MQLNASNIKVQESSFPQICPRLYLLCVAKTNQNSYYKPMSVIQDDGAYDNI